MCGIVGLISINQVNKEDVISMTESLRHRGPDAQGMFFNKNETVCLGHTRLSIIDLSTNANQPFFSTSGRYIAVFNGEIYNFQRVRKTLHEEHGVSFKTNSDTEVIVEGFAIWGKEVVNLLQGMFAICIYDQQLNTLYLFRDRVGKKPLFYFVSDGLFAFASEIKSLLKLQSIKEGIEINQNAISPFLHLGYIPEPDTIYTNIYKFPSGQLGKITSDLKLKMEPYWNINSSFDQHTLTSPQKAKKKLNELLQQSVQDRLISDVPLGAFLSGGTDSSLITAIASKQVSIPFRTFSIGFRESKFNESHHALAVSKELKTNHSEYILSEIEAIDILETYLRHFDEPFADTSAIPTMLVSKLARQEVKVVLTGDGGDELFHGYGAYVWANRLESVAWKPFLKSLRYLFQMSGQSQWQRVAELLTPVDQAQLRSHIFSQEQYFFSQSEIQETLLKDPSLFKPFLYSDPAMPNATPAEKQALFDFRYYLKDDLLVKVDRASMFYALECRSPLLDHTIVEFAASLHPSLKMRRGEKKWILKEILRDHIPNQLVDKPKWGFSVPLSSWLKGELRYLIDHYLNHDFIEKVGIFRSAVIQKLIDDFFNGKDYLYNRIWVLIVLHKWLDENS